MAHAGGKWQRLPLASALPRDKAPRVWQVASQSPTYVARSRHVRKDKPLLWTLSQTFVAPDRCFTFASFAKLFITATNTRFVLVCLLAVLFAFAQAIRQSNPANETTKNPTADQLNATCPRCNTWTAACGLSVCPIP